MHAILLNIRHGGGRRAQALLEWITARSPDVVVLPEWRDNSAGDVLRRGLEAKGLQIATATLSKESNGVLLAAKRPFEFYCGTPVGAMNGALIVGDFGSEVLRRGISFLYRGSSRDRQRACTERFAGAAIVVGQS